MQLFKFMSSDSIFLNLFIFICLHFNCQCVSQTFLPDVGILKMWDEQNKKFTWLSYLFFFVLKNKNGTTFKNLWFLTLAELKNPSTTKGLINAH